MSELDKVIREAKKAREAEMRAAEELASTAASQQVTEDQDKERRTKEVLTLAARLYELLDSHGSPGTEAVHDFRGVLGRHRPKPKHRRGWLLATTTDGSFSMYDATITRHRGLILLKNGELLMAQGYGMEQGEPPKPPYVVHPQSRYPHQANPGQGFSPADVAAHIGQILARTGLEW